jgi:hypothetical protein
MVSGIVPSGRPWSCIVHEKSAPDIRLEPIDQVRGDREAAEQAAGAGADLEDAVGVLVSHHGPPGAKRPVGRPGLRG